MTRLLAPLSVLSLLALTGCPPICEFGPSPGPGENNRLEEGQWRFELSEIEASGQCGDIGEPSPEDLRLGGSIHYTQGRHLEIDIEGLLLSGAQDGREIFAEGYEYYDVAVDEDTAEPAPAGEESEGDDGDEGGDEDRDEDSEETEPCETEESEEGYGGSCGGGGYGGGGYGGGSGYGESGLEVYLDGRIESPVDLIGTLTISQYELGWDCVLEAHYTAWFVGHGGGSGQTEPVYAEEEEGELLD